MNYLYIFISIFCLNSNKVEATMTKEDCQNVLPTIESVVSEVTGAFNVCITFEFQIQWSLEVIIFHP